MEKYHEIKRGRGETVAGTAKKVEELNVQLFDEIDFEDTAPFRESPDAWRMLIYEEICADEKISQAKIDYRRIGEISEQKLFRRLIEEADKRQMPYCGKWQDGNCGA